MIFKEATTGLEQLVDSFALRNEVTSSLLFGLSAGFLTFAISSRLPIRFLGVIAVPGLCGPLIVALGSVRVFQLESLRVLYDSPIPLIGVLVVLLLPVTFLIQLLRRPQLAGESAHVAVMSGAWQARWLMIGRGNFGVVLLLFLLAFSELLASAILAPPGMATAPARLYNLMHYGQTAVLSAMVLAVFLFPLLVTCIVIGGVECIVRSRRAIGR